VLYYRMSKLGHGRMPQFGSQVIDREGVKLIREWIESLKPDPNAIHPQVRRQRDQEFTLVEQLSDARANGAHVSQALAKILATPSGALILVDALTKGEVPQTVASTAIELGNSHTEPTIRDLFEQFLPEEKRVKRLGSVIDSQDILSQRGNADRGKRLILETTGVQCKNCHRIGNQGQTLGPDLTQVGKKLNRVQLLESLTEPSKTMDAQYTTYLAESADGRVITGLLVNQDERGVVLRQADRSEVHLPTEEIERLVPQRKSLMPELLLSELTADQVRDLLEYLEQLK